LGRKKKIEPKQLNLFQENNVVSLDEWKKSNKKVKKRVQHEKKFQGKITDILDQLGLVWIHIKNKCFNKFYHECSNCGNKELITCHATINKELTGYPDIMIVAGGLELKNRKYGVKTAKYRNGAQKEVCEKLEELIEIKCINQESQDELMSFLKNMVFKIKGEKI